MGELARLLSKSVPQIKNSAAKTDTTIIFINQVRDKLTYGGGTTTPGGRAVPFYSSIRLKITKKDLITDAAKKVIGQEIEVKFIKNKVGTPYEEVKTKLFFGKGFDKEFEYADIAFKYEIIARKGAWYFWDNQEGTSLRWQGAIKVAEHFKDNPEDFKFLSSQIKEMQQKGTPPVIEVDSEIDEDSYD